MKTKYIFLIIATFFFTSCSKDNLFLEPEVSLSDDAVLESKETAQTVLMGAYAITGDYRYLTISNISMDVMGNDVMISDGSFGFSTYEWLKHSYNYNQNPRVVDGWWSAYSPTMWKYAYQAIDQCNLIIDSKDNLPADTEDILAQAYGIRAYNYLKLYNLYCQSYVNDGANGKGLFLRLKPGTPNEEDNVPRSNLKESLEQIISDFEYAYNNVSNNNQSLINKKGVAVLLARTYMEIENYDKAQEYIETLSDFNGSDLMSKQEYQSGFNTINSEWLWGFNFTDETTNIYASIPSFYWAAGAKDQNSTFGTEEYGSKTTYSYLENNAINWLTGYSTIRIPFSFANSFGSNDYRALFPFYISEKDGLFTSKFSSKESLGVADYPLARIAEAYLIEAEILFRKGDPKGLQILNTLQEMRDGKLSQTITIEEIWKERRRELYGEGFALQDIKRLQRSLERTGQEQWSLVKSLPSDSPRLMFPIPGDELDYNNKTSNDDQNDYWR